MAMSLLDEGSSPWEDPFIGVFDQSSDTFDIPNINWDLDLENLDEDSPVLATNIVRASTPPAPQEIFASGSPLAETPERPRRPKSKKGRKGRPKSTLEDGQSAVERRRTQVRLAQRAYRNRKEITVASLRRDVDDLKTRLLGMEYIADELFEITCSLPYLPEDTIPTIQTLRKEEKNYRLPIHLRNVARAAEATQGNAVIPTAKDNDAVNSLSAPVIRTNLDVLSSQLRDDQTTPRLSPLNPDIDQHPHSFDIFPDIQIPQPSFGPSVSAFGNFNDSLLKFSLRLRYEALREAYNLAKKPETPYKVLCEVFRYCIFSCTRDEIVRHLDFLIQESAKTTYQTLASMITGGVDSLSDKALSLPGHYVRVESAGLEIDDAYMGPEGVTSYLYERGLAIDPGLSHAEFTMNPGNLFGSAATLFDEIRQKTKIKISMSKLRHELLGRMVCLEVGPGIRTSKIDEAIRSTVIAAI